MTLFTADIKNQCYESQVSKFIDGDTLDMNINLGFNVYIIKRIRLVDIDAPEIHNTSKSSDEYKRGEVATVQLKEWFYSRGSIFYLLAEHKDLYGRWLGQIFYALGEKSLNDVMIDYGYYNGGWSWETQKALIEQWYKSEQFHNWGNDPFLGCNTKLVQRGLSAEE